MLLNLLLILTKSYSFHMQEAETTIGIWVYGYMGIKITPKSQGLTFINTSESKKVKNLPLTELRKYKTWQN